MKRLIFFSSLFLLALSSCARSQTVPSVVAHTPAPIASATPAVTPTPGWWMTATVRLGSPEPPTATGTPATPVTPRPTATPTETPRPILERLKGRILFRTDRSGWGTEIWVMDPDGSNQHKLDIPEVEDDFLGEEAEAIYQEALEEQSWNDARDHKVLVQAAYGHPQIYVLRLQDDHRWGITQQSTLAYDPRWQPGGGWIVFTSPDDGDDEIWRVTNEGERLQQLTRNDWEHDKFPSWSPDGREITFWSNRLVGHPQIWVMDLDGQWQRNVSGNDFNDWDPVWVIGKRGPTPTPTATTTQ
jgi:hypothetical protein